MFFNIIEALEPFKIFETIGSLRQRPRPRASPGLHVIIKQQETKN
jgi:hypothetical protein